MSTIRGRVWTTRKVIQKCVTVGGEWPYYECECGGWVDKETGEHAEVMSLNEFLEGAVKEPVTCTKEKSQ
jgi:hypothetical protein